MNIYYWGGKWGGKKWRLKIGAINVAIFGKYAADFGFLALVTLHSSPKSRCIQAGRTFKKTSIISKKGKENARRLHPKIQFGLRSLRLFFQVLLPT